MRSVQPWDIESNLQLQKDCKVDFSSCERNKILDILEGGSELTHLRALELGITVDFRTRISEICKDYPIGKRMVNYVTREGQTVRVAAYYLERG